MAEIRGLANGSGMRSRLRSITGVMDGLVERGDVCEGLVGEVMGLKIAPDRLDVVEFGGVFRQPLHSEPVFARFEGFES